MLIFFLLISAESIFSQNKSDEKNRKIEFKNLPYFIDDIQLVAGFNHSGVYYSNHYKDLKYRPGFQVGLEKYIPMERILFLSVGIHYTERNFTHSGQERTSFVNNYLDVPIFTSFELPEFKDYDLRFILGVQAGVRLGTTQNGSYSEQYTMSPDNFAYSTSDFHRFDAGWAFGLSAEYKNVLFRFRSYVGFRKMDLNEQGMINSFNFDIGYFIFRPLRKI